MEKEAGDSVLALFRKIEFVFTFRSIITLSGREMVRFPKPYDREYVYDLENDSLSFWEHSNRSAVNENNRKRYNNLSSATYATLAKSRAVSAGARSVCTGVIDDPLINHHFCVADYSPHAGSAESIDELPFDSSGKSAWIIDPWMNISCDFLEYPNRVMNKLFKWSNKQKKVVRDEKAHDPLSSLFLNTFFTAELKFVDCWDNKSGKAFSEEKGIPWALRNRLPKWAPLG